jgi:hypothetical protein
MTRPSDRLPAISGIAQRFGSGLSDEYVAGIWRNTLPFGLLWRPSGTATTSAEDCAPSWSWASVDCGVSCSTFQSRYLRAPVLTAKVLHVDIDLLTESSLYGEVRGGSLPLSGRVLSRTARLCKMGNHSYIDTSIASFRILFDREDPEIDLDAGYPVLLLEISAFSVARSLEGLVLCEEPDRSSYRRVGYFWVVAGNEKREGFQS